MNKTVTTPTGTEIKDLHAELLGHIPTLAITVARQMASQYEWLVKTFGLDLQGQRDESGKRLSVSVFNSTSYKLWAYSIAGVCDSLHLDRLNRKVEYRLNGAKLAQRAEKIATEIVTVWEAKITEKIGNLTEMTIYSLGGTGFAISGTRQGRKVYIEQHMIVNMSSKGTLFNQFPARIYLDGKFISAAAYQRTFSN